LIEPMKVWDALEKKIFDVLRINYFTQEIRLKGIGDRSFDLVAPIHFTGFHDINGEDPTRKLWEGDIGEIEFATGKEYGVIVWDSETGAWMIRFKTGNLFLYQFFQTWSDRNAGNYAGNIYETPGLVPWWKGWNDEH
jgi:hypothetical protein